MMKRLFAVALGASLLFLLAITAGCTVTPEEATPSPLATTGVEPSPTLQPTASGTAIATAAVSATPEVAEATATAPVATTTAVPEPTSAPEGQTLLPAPLYYLNNGQILRLEVDGFTVTPITSEMAPVTGFDIHPGSGLLVYVSDNDLIQANAGGGERQVLVEGADFAEDDYAEGIPEEIRNPFISPDGSQIAFGLNGVNVIAPGDTSGNYTVLQASDPYPASPADMPAEGPIRFFWPRWWAPDGSKLLVEFAYYPEAGGLAIYNFADGSLVDIDNPEHITVGDWTWGNDSQTGFIGSNVMVYGAPGLVRVDATNGNSTTLIKGLPDGEVSPENPARTFQAPHQSDDGNLLAFAQEASNLQYLGDRGRYQIYQISADGSMMTPVREDSYVIGEVLWADNDLGAVFVDISNDQDFPYTGPMRWLPVEGGPILDLAASGSNLRWGGAVTGPRTGGPNPAQLDDLAEQFKATLALQPESGLQEVVVRRLTTPEDNLWLAHTVGMRSFDPLQPHVVAAYRYTAGGWQEAGRMEFAEGGDRDTLPGPDYLGEDSVRQVFVEPSHTWVAVNGGIGAHAGIFHLLRHNGQSFVDASANSNSSPRAGWVEDLNGDGLQEVILNLTDPYVFYYASGVRLVNYELQRWQGEELETVELICCQGSGTAWELNDQAVALAEAELWRDARAIIEQAEAAAAGDSIIAWNATLIGLIADGRENAVGPYPLLGNVFFGAYERAVDSMRGYDPAELFGDSPPFIRGTVAEGSLAYMVEYMLSFTEEALSVKPELAPAHFIRGWALHQANPGDPAALESISRAQLLAPDDALYSQSVNYLSP